MDLISQDVVYLRTNRLGSYWGKNGNAKALDRTFGTDGWKRRSFETVDINELFDTDSHAVIFMDGSELGTCYLIDFFNTHQAEFEKFVMQGGALFINIAASSCITQPINLGFDGVLSTFAGVVPNKRYGIPVNSGHDVFIGPKAPAFATLYEGGNLAHNFLTGGKLSSILETTESNVILAEKLYGDGLVVFGGITLEWIGESEFWGPQPELNNLYDNILMYLYIHGTGGLCLDPPSVITQDITVALDVDGLASIEASQIDNGSSSACGDLSYAIDITDFTCLEVGENTVTLTVLDVNNVSASAPATVTVEDITPPMVITKNIIVQLDELGIASITPEDVHESSSDACGIVSMELDITKFSCDNIGNNSVLLMVTDNNGNMTSEQAIVTVENDTPVLISLDVPSGPIVLNEEINVSAVYKDVNLASATWEWSDGTTSAGIISAGNITGSHTYTEPGVFTVSLLIKDVCGQTGQGSFDYIVIVDPDGAFVTGGGYLNSPKGAYIGDESISGKAHFAFVAKYKKAKKHKKDKDHKGYIGDKDYSSMPHGVTVFYLKEAKLKFKSKSVDWLMVNGNVAMYQGTGKIKKDPTDYRYQVSVIDDGRGKKAEDKYRFQLWDIASGALVYDNQLGDETNANATQVIDKGAIVIHHYTEYDEEDEGEDEDGDHDDDDEDGDDDDDDGDDDDDDDSGSRYTSGTLANVSVEIYPNPVANVLQIKIGNEISDNNQTLKISIVGINGSKKVISERENISGPTVLEYDLSGLEKGIYYLVLEGENINKAIKFIKY
ncbi:MAG: hypothetical protein DRI71_06545 [Bacteroidetes bacterium]|nr:MAG: hypothetical protein DRI71_06545 [Bacteroidota bacterium]